MWSTTSQSNPITDDVMWYATWTGQPWPPPANYIAALGSRNPRLAVGPQNHLHAAFMTYRRPNGPYDADYIEQLPTDTDRPLPGPQTDPDNLLFPTPDEASDVGLTVSTGGDGLEQGHVVWSENTGLRPPPLYYGRAHRPPNSLAPTADIFGPLGAAGCLGPSSPDCYRGFKPSVAVVNRPGGSDKDLVVVWEGRDAFSPTPQTQVIYSGTRRLCPPDQTCLWSPPQAVSNNQLSKRNKTSQVCSAQDPQPTLRAVASSIAMSPRGTLHAVWLQQLQTNGPYYVHTARLVYDPSAQDYCWDYFETISAEPVPPESGGTPPGERPRLAFDQQRRRYAVWNVGLQRVVVATSDLDVAASTGDYDVYRPWQVHDPINTGDCAGQSGVRGVDVGTREGGNQFVHVVWAALTSQTAGRICYARLGYGYQTYVPRIDKAGSLGH